MWPIRLKNQWMPIKNIDMLGNIKKEHQNWKIAVIIVITASALSTPISLYFFYKLNQDAMSSVWVVNDGQAI